MTFYLFLADRHGTSSGARWAIMGIAVKVGQSVGYFCTSSFIIFLIVMWPRSLDWTAYVFRKVILGVTLTFSIYRP